jgi:hypothetical protein
MVAVPSAGFYVKVFDALRTRGVFSERQLHAFRGLG